MTWESYKDSAQRLELLISEKRFAEALRLVEELLKRIPGSVALLVKRGRLIQLQNGDADLPPLEAARESFERAIELEPDSVEAQIELAYFEYAVTNHIESALIHFEQAARQAEAGLKDALIGLVKCQIELERSDDALRTLERAKSIFPDDLDLLILEAEFTE